MLSSTEIPCALCGCAASEPKETPCTCCPVLERTDAHANKGKSSSRQEGLQGVLCVALFSGSRMAQRREDNKRDTEGRSCVYVLLHVYVQILMHSVQVCMHICVPVEAEGQSIASTLISEKGSLTGWSSQRGPGWLTSLRDPPVSASQAGVCHRAWLLPGFCDSAFWYSC